MREVERPRHRARSCLRKSWHLRWGLGFVLCFGFAAASRAASWQALDARTLGRGGIAVLDRLDESPGALIPTGFEVQAGGVRHFLGSGLVARFVHVHRAGERLAWSLGVDQLQSDIHLEQHSITALQVRTFGLAAGIAVGWRELRFVRHAPWRRPLIRLGIGLRLRERVQVVARLERTDWRSSPPRFTTATRVDLGNGVDAALQVEREPGLPPRLLASLACQLATPLEALCGYDATTDGFAAGIVARAASLRLTLSMASHPELGWSQAWMLAWRR